MHYIWVAFGLLLLASGQDANNPAIVPLYRIFETSILNNRPYQNKFTDVDLNVEYTSPSGRTIRFWGFFDGDGQGGGNRTTGNVWKLRFMPDEIGTWLYTYNWSDGTVGGQGQFICVKDGAGKGVLRPYKDNPHWFAYNGDQPVWLKSYYETGHGAIAQDFDWVVQNVYSRFIENGYNHLQVNWLLSLCCFKQYYLDGPPPKTFDLALYQDGKPSETMRLDVWHMMERHLRFLNDHDIAVHMFLGFDGGKNDGPSWARLSQQERDFYVRYVVLRLAPFANLAGWNLVWEVEGNREEYELGWARLVRKYDIFGHLITYEDETPRDNFYELAEYSFAAVENHLIAGPSKDLDRHYWKEPWTHHMAALAAHKGKPVYMSEGNALWRRYWHERTGATPEHLRRAAWACVTAGASFCWNGHLKEYELYAGGPTGLPFNKDNPYAIAERYIQILTDLMNSQVEFYRLNPADALLRDHDGMRVWALAEPGRQYLVFAISGEPFGIQLAKGTYSDNIWIDTKTGAQHPERPLSIDTEQDQVIRFMPPDNQTDWVLILRKPGVSRGLARQPLSEDPQKVYERTITQRATRIVDGLGLDDLGKAMIVRDIIKEQYRSIGQVHDRCDELIRSLRKAAPDDPNTQVSISAIQQMSDALLKTLHQRFIQRLSRLLTEQQIEKVKDGMTYGLVQVTLDAYLGMLPQLTSQQKQRIVDLLLEAREQAMDAGSSQQKHAIFNRYKGRINNYLSKEGYDLRKASEALRGQ